MKILVIQQKMIGDVLTSSILFPALKAKYPSSELHYLIYPNTKAVVESNPHIDKILEFNPDSNSSLPGFFSFLRKIRSESYDIVVDPYSKISTGIIAIFSGAQKRIGFHKDYTKQFYTHTFKYKVQPETAAGLAIENRMLLLQALDPDFPKESKPTIILEEKDKLEIKKKLLAAGLDPDNPLLMCGVLGSNKNKSYPAPFMAKVLDQIAHQVKNVQILLNYMPSQEIEAEEIFKLCAEATKKQIFKNFYGRELGDFIRICASCDVYVGNEGGAANIAKALSIPTFSIYSPLVEKKHWALYEDGIRNRSIHPEDFSAQTPGSYENLHPEKFQNELNYFLQKNLNVKIKTHS